MTDCAMNSHRHDQAPNGCLALVGTLSFSGTPDNYGTDILTMFDNDFPAGAWCATDGTDLTGLVVYDDTTVNAVP